MMSIINSKFDRTIKVLSKVTNESQIPISLVEFDYVMSNLDSRLKQEFKSYSASIKALYQFEKEIVEKCCIADLFKLLKNHVRNSVCVERSISDDPCALLKWQYQVNPDTFIINCKVDFENLFSAIDSIKIFETETEIPFFVRPSLFQKDSFIELILVDWNLVLIDLFECDSFFTGSDIVEILLPNVENFGGIDSLRQKVVEFLRVQLVYMNSLVIV